MLPQLLHRSSAPDLVVVWGQLWPHLPHLAKCRLAAAAALAPFLACGEPNSFAPQPLPSAASTGASSATSAASPSLTAARRSHRR